MTDPRDEPRLRSRLPDDPGYWRALADRILETAAPHLRRLRAGRTAWWSALESSWSVLATAAAAAVLATILLVPPRALRPAVPTAPNAYALLPADPAAAPVVLADTPPSVDALLGLATRKDER